MLTWPWNFDLRNQIFSWRANFWPEKTNFGQIFYLKNRNLILETQNFWRVKPICPIHMISMTNKWITLLIGGQRISNDVQRDHPKRNGRRRPIALSHPGDFVAAAQWNHCDAADEPAEERQRWIAAVARWNDGDQRRGPVDQPVAACRWPVPVEDCCRPIVGTFRSKSNENYSFNIDRIHSTVQISKILTRKPQFWPFFILKNHHFDQFLTLNQKFDLKKPNFDKCST